MILTDYQEAITVETLTEAMIRRHTDSRSFARGEEYYREGAVGTIMRRGPLLQTEVEGSDAEPYEVTVTFTPNGGVEAECDCPTAGKDWCKHIVAVLLLFLNEPEEVEDLPPLETLLSPLDRNAMQTLLLNLVRRRPELAAEIELELASFQPPSAQSPPLPSGGTPSRAPVDPSVIRRQVRTVLKGVASGTDHDYWNDDDSDRVEDLENGIFPLIEIAEASVKAGDGRSALPILEALTDELIDGWDRVESIIGDAGELFDDLGRAWAEAILTTELNSKERQSWISRLDKWRDAGQYCGAQSGLAVAVEAARLGWDYPPLVRVLQGEVTDKGAWEDEAPDCADELAVARLNVLERQGRWQEAAYLAEAESQHDRYMTLLVRLDRAKEAVEYGMEVLTTADNALTLASTLYEHGDTGLSFRIATHGLRLQGPCYKLATWLRDAALATGDTGRAISAAKSAIQESPQLKDYTHLQEFAGERWPPLRDEILASLRKSLSYNASSKVDIFLYEGLLEDALQMVRDSWDYYLVARVVEAATSTYPLQVIPLCKGQAATIMDAGKADRYHHAAQWVERVRDAYRVAGQEVEWREYKAGLLATHQRKYKLIPLLRDL